MSDDPQPVDFWSVLQDAKVTVEQWPAWQRRYDADVHYEGESTDLPEE